MGHAYVRHASVRHAYVSHAYVRAPSYLYPTAGESYERGAWGVRARGAFHSGMGARGIGRRATEVCTACKCTCMCLLLLTWSYMVGDGSSGRHSLSLFVVTLLTTTDWLWIPWLFQISAHLSASLTNASLADDWQVDLLRAGARERRLGGCRREHGRIHGLKVQGEANGMKGQVEP